MMKKIWLLTALLTAVALVVLIITNFYFKQEHAILTKKFGIYINREIEITYFENNTSDDPYCFAALKANDKEYKKLLQKMKKADYYIYEDLDDMYLQQYSEWMDFENIVQAYQMDTAEYSFISIRRIHANIFITDSENGYRNIYLHRN